MAIIEKKTAFRPTRHGFHFKNGFTGWIPYLCEGMVWTALDRYFGNIDKPIPALNTPPDVGSQLYNEIVFRNIDYYRGVGLVNKLIDWMSRDDRDHTGFWHKQSIGSMTQKNEWPVIKNLLDAGYPSSITLVIGRNREIIDALSRISDPLDFFRGIFDPLDILKCLPITRNHAVLATGYKLDDSTGRLILNIYDPNYPDDDNVTLAVDLGKENSALHPVHSRGTKFRGFFYWPYDKTMQVITEQSIEEEVLEDDETPWWILME